jgi:hypothetical protein
VRLLVTLVQYGTGTDNLEAGKCKVCSTCTGTGTLSFPVVCRMYITFQYCIWYRYVVGFFADVQIQKVPYLRCCVAVAGGIPVPIRYGTKVQYPVSSVEFC